MAELLAVTDGTEHHMPTPAVTRNLRTTFEGLSNQATRTRNLFLYADGAYYVMALSARRPSEFVQGITPDPCCRFEHWQIVCQGINS
jgi:hypothetical protein